MENLYHIIAGSAADGSRTYPRLSFTHCIGVKETALAHVRALEVPPLPKPKRKRFILSGAKPTWPEISDYLATSRPNISDRLVKNADDTGPRRYACVKVSTKLTEELLGISKEEMGDWRTCVGEGVDELLKWERDIAWR
jgi:hypothetical protein